MYTYTNLPIPRHSPIHLRVPQMDAFTVASYLLGCFRQHLSERVQRLGSDMAVPSMRYADVSLVQLPQCIPDGAATDQLRYMLMVRACGLLPRA